MSVATRASERTPLRERKKAEAREALSEAALELFVARGFSAVTVDDIAERAGVSRRTFFRYFATKEDVVFERRLAQLAAFRAHLGSAPREQPPLDVLRGAFRLVAQDYEASKRRVLAERALFASARELGARDLEIDRAFEQSIAEALVDRGGKGGPTLRAARFFAAAAMAVVRVALDEWAASRGKLDLLDLGLPELQKLEVLAPRRASP